MVSGRLLLHYRAILVYEPAPAVGSPLTAEGCFLAEGEEDLFVEIVFGSVVLLSFVIVLWC